ncbi:MAG: AsnC family transcriptional regulator [Sporolactobacillus sp.]
MDEIDQKIIDVLHENSRMTWKDIGMRVHLTGQAVGARIERLISDGHIRKFTVDVREENTAFITVYMKTPAYRDFETTFSEHPAVERLDKISGDGCYFMTVHLPSDLLDLFCAALLDYGRYQINLSLRQIK